MKAIVEKDLVNFFFIISYQVHVIDCINALKSSIFMIIKTLTINIIDIKLLKY